jgi:hypothetical protein
MPRKFYDDDAASEHEAATKKVWIVEMSIDLGRDNYSYYARMFDTRKAAFDYTFSTKKEVSCIKEVTQGEASKVVYYILRDSCIYRSDSDCYRQHEVVATCAGDTSLQDVIKDKETLAALMKEHGFRIAVLRSLYNMQAVKNGEKASFGESLIRYGYTTKSNPYGHIPKNFVQLLKDDIAAVEELNGKLSDWIQDMRDKVGHKDDITTLAAPVSYSKSTFEPTVKFPAAVQG